jgi:fatty-acyl-CoA synthase
VVLFDRFEPDEFLRGIAEEKCTVVLTVPTQLVMMRNCGSWGINLPHLRFFISGGAPCPATLINEIRGCGYKLKTGYGLTECGPNCFAISDAEALSREGSVGWPIAFLEMSLRNDDGVECEVDEPGELLLRGPQMFGGYLHDEAKTAEAMSEGWLKTGDLAKRDSDGAYYICGRKKEMFISGGENVFPAEVEAAIGSHPGVSEVVVVGVSDSLWGEVGRAHVILRPGATPIPETELLDFARTLLAKYKVPKSVVFMEDFPRLGSGKADRRSLAAASSTSSVQS